MAVTDQAFNSLRDRVIEVERKQAVREETLANINTRLTNIESTLSRLVWLMVAAIVAAAASFIIHGGLDIVPH